MRPALSLSILDFCRVYPQTLDPVEAVWSTLDLAVEAERLGYKRYWLGEHHTRDVAHSSPEILVSVIAGMTQHIRVGAAGMLIRYHSPLKLAKTFLLLNALFPERIDIGIARGFAEAPVPELLMGESPVLDPYDQKVEDLVRFLRGTGSLPANPIGVAAPETWILGSRTGSVDGAARLGCAFSLSLFFGELSDDKRSVIDTYRERFLPSATLREPKYSIAVAGVCAPTSAEAEAIARQWAPGVSPGVVGDVAQCRDQLHETAMYYGTKEIVFLDVSPSHAERMQSYRLLAEACGLEQTTSRQIRRRRAPAKDPGV